MHCRWHWILNSLHEIVSSKKEEWCNETTWKNSLKIHRNRFESFHTQNHTKIASSKSLKVFLFFSLYFSTTIFFSLLFSFQTIAIETRNCYKFLVGFLVTFNALSRGFIVIVFNFTVRCHESCKFLPFCLVISIQAKNRLLFRSYFISEQVSRFGFLIFFVIGFKETLQFSIFSCLLVCASKRSMSFGLFDSV